MPDPDPRLFVYRLLYADIEILEELARQAMMHGHTDWAAKIRGVIERARENPYTE